MLFIIIPGVITVISVIIAIVFHFLDNKVFYKKYKLYDRMAEKYHWSNHPAPLTDDERKEANKIRIQREKYWKISDVFDNMVVPFAAIAIIAGTILVILTVIVAVSNIPYEIKIRNNREIQNYQKLIFELENQEVRDDFNIRTKDLIDDVTEWNKDYDTYVYRHNNLWTSWFYPSGVIQGIDRINLEDYI